MTLGKPPGFTLIEILVAITIFSFAILGLAMGTVTIVRTNQNSHLRANAVNLAQSKLEELRAMSGSAFSGLSCPTFTTAGCSESINASGIVYTRSWTIIANSPVSGVNKIELKIDWRDYTDQKLYFSASVPQT